MSNDVIDRTELTSLAVDCYGTLRPEQAYSVVDKGNWTHLYTHVHNVGPFTRVQANPSRVAEERLRRPFVFLLDLPRDVCCFNEGINDAVTLHIVRNRTTGKLDRADIGRSLIDVNQRYIPPVAWTSIEEATQAIDVIETEKLPRAAMVPYLSLAEAAQLTKGTGTETIDDALHAMHLLAHYTIGTHFADQSVPALYLHEKNGSVSYKEHRIGKVPRTGMTAGARRFTHRANNLQLDRLLRQVPTIDELTFREIVRGVDYWRNAA